MWACFNILNCWFQKINFSDNVKLDWLYMHCSLFKPGMPRMILSKLNPRDGLCTRTKFVLKFTYLFRTFSFLPFNICILLENLSLCVFIKDWLDNSFFMNVSNIIVSFSIIKYKVEKLHYTKTCTSLFTTITNPSLFTINSLQCVNLENRQCCCSFYCTVC